MSTVVITPVSGLLGKMLRDQNRLGGAKANDFFRGRKGLAHSTFICRFKGRAELTD